jgi:predicted DCC family thiol-disulfide oxidoreductase YuxK
MSRLQIQGGYETHLILYDGVCGLCNRFVRFVVAHDRAHIFQFASLQSRVAQSALSPFGLDPSDLTTFYLLPRHGTGGSFPLSKSRATFFVLGALGWPWRAARVLAVLPSSATDRLYDALAENRYRLFGRHELCAMPRADDPDRFIQ